jgi:hypothetical protein
VSINSHYNAKLMAAARNSSTVVRRSLICVSREW